MPTNPLLNPSMVQKQNIDRFQSWMRTNGATVAKAHIQSQSRDILMGIQGENDEHWDRTRIPQTPFGPQNMIEPEQDMRPLEALREIIRFTIMADTFIQNLVWNTGATITVPSEGPMMIESHQAALSIPKRDVH